MSKPRVDIGDPCQAILTFGDGEAKCTGTMEWLTPMDCACHIHPPCSACENQPLVCTECGAESA